MDSLQPHQQLLEDLERGFPLEMALLYCLRTTLPRGLWSDARKVWQEIERLCAAIAPAHPTTPEQMRSLLTVLCPGLEGQKLAIRLKYAHVRERFLRTQEMRTQGVLPSGTTEPGPGAFISEDRKARELTNTSATRNTSSTAMKMRFPRIGPSSVHSSL